VVTQLRTRIFAGPNVLEKCRLDVGRNLACENYLEVVYSNRTEGSISLDIDDFVIDGGVNFDTSSAGVVVGTKADVNM